MKEKEKEKEEEKGKKIGAGEMAKMLPMASQSNSVWERALMFSYPCC